VQGYLQECKGMVLQKVFSVNALQTGMDHALKSARTRKENTTMKTTIANKMAYLGTGAGLILFAIFGIMPGTLVGGAMGLSMAGAIFGTPVEPGVLARMVLAASMLVGILATGFLMVTATATVGWLAGTAVDAIAGKGHKTAEARS